MLWEAQYQEYFPYYRYYQQGYQNYEQAFNSQGQNFSDQLFQQQQHQLYGQHLQQSQQQDVYHMVNANQVESVGSSAQHNVTSTADSMSPTAQEGGLSFSPSSSVSVPGITTLDQARDALDHDETDVEEEETRKGGVRAFVCQFPRCNYGTNRRNNLKRHMITMHELLSAPQTCCGSTFYRKADVRAHVKEIHSEGYICDWNDNSGHNTICGKKFARKALLDRHTKIHTGEKPYTCHYSMCHYGTSHRSNLERHQKIHEKNQSAPAFQQYTQQNMAMYHDQSNSYGNQIKQLFMGNHFYPPYNNQQLQQNYSSQSSQQELWSRHKMNNDVGATSKLFFNNQSQENFQNYCNEYSQNFWFNQQNSINGDQKMMNAQPEHQLPDSTTEKPTVDASQNSYNNLFASYKQYESKVVRSGEKMNGQYQMSGSQQMSSQLRETMQPQKNGVQQDYFFEMNHAAVFDTPVKSESPGSCSSTKVSPNQLEQMHRYSQVGGAAPAGLSIRHSIGNILGDEEEEPEYSHIPGMKHYNMKQDVANFDRRKQINFPDRVSSAMCTPPPDHHLENFSASGSRSEEESSPESSDALGEDYLPKKLRIAKRH